MKTPIHINNIRETEKYTQYPYIVEVSAWSDCGQTERWGAETESEAREILEEETLAAITWYAGYLESESPTADDDDLGVDEAGEVPEIAQILVRPEADEDGDYDGLDSWEAL